MRTHVPHLRRGDAVLSMTPMIDVVFLLLIFFVCTASFQPLEFVLPSRIPEPSRGSSPLPDELQELDLERIVVKLTAESQKLSLLINEQVVPSLARLRELLDALAAIDASLPVILDVDVDVPLGAAMDVCDQCRLAGFGKVQFAARLP